MMHVFKRAWLDMILPIWQRPVRIQVAALCHRATQGGTEVLLITSRDTGRWILPKGWPIDGLDGPGAALQEAWEEAGVTEAQIDAEPLGSYDYDKVLDGGMTTPVHTAVYLTEVKALSDTYPESDLRDRAWFAPAEAAEKVAEPELQAILRAL